MVIVALASSLAYASDPSPLQDFCVAVDDANAADLQGSKNGDSRRFLLFRPKQAWKHIKSTWIKSHPCDCQPATRTQHSRHFFGSCRFRTKRAQPAPHTPRATEVLVVVQGTLYVGFVTSNPANPNTNNKLFTKTLYPGDVFVFPEGLIHFQLNVGKTNVVAFAGLSSQNPGVITIANAVFGTDPPISTDVLTRAFQVDVNVVKYLQGQF
ncbi:hypothetical protein DH2020_015791 [Rehmannia glutinosa]|uniref:Germin-like protein n=1 Tax=Rehmannia glutinosa TaxID=99300 RepID=A0ABR0WX66_REHGL